MHNLTHGLTALCTVSALGYLIGGALLGVVVGVIPGLSTVLILSVLLVFLNHVSLTGCLCLFLGAQCGSFYSASVTAILLNTPAHPEAFPITLDGYPMARKGQPGRALGLSAASTCLGGFIGCGILIGFLQVIDYLPDLFHPPEFVALVTLAMLMIGTLGTDSIGKALAAAGMGLALASVGPSAISGTYRYTFGSVNLYSGVSLVALALGVFAIPQMIMVFGTGTAVARQDMTGQEVDAFEAVELTGGYFRQFLGGVWETFRHWRVTLQSGIVGGLTGIIPGIGGFTGNFLAYGVARQTSRKRELYGTGIPDGIIAPEGSSIAKEAGHIVPILGLGIPGGVAGALFIAALSIKNIKTGSGFDSAYPGVTGQIVWIIALSGLIGTLAGALIGPQLARITKVPGPLIVPFILALCVSGPFLTDTQFFSVIEMVVFGFVGLALRRLRYPLGSFIMGLVLGPTFEQNIYLTHNIYPGFSFLAKRPLADVLFGIAIVVLIAKTVEVRNERRKRRRELAAGGELTEARQRAERRRLAPYPLLAPLVSLVILGCSLYVVIFAATNYDFTTGIMPIIGGLLMAAPTALFLPRDIVRYLQYRRDKKADARAAPADAPAPELVTAAVGGQIADRGLLVTALELPADEPAPRPLGPDTASPNRPQSGGSIPAAAGGGGASVERSWGRNGQYRWEIGGLLWFVLAFALCWLVGFVWGTTVFMAAYGVFSSRRCLKTWRTQLLFTVVSTAIMWLATYEMFDLTHLTYAPVINL